MNTSKQVNVMIGLLFLAFIAFGAYFVTEPAREASAREAQAEMMAERGAHIFVANCRTCHGQEGLGTDEGGVGPRLNNVAFLVLGEKNPFGIKPTAVGDANKIHDFLFNTIACGRTNTAMPNWSDHYGGPLSSTQIGYLVTMITDGRWDLVEEYGHANDAALKAQHSAAIAMFGKSYDDPRPPGKGQAPILEKDQKKAVDDAITAGTAKKYQDLTVAQQKAVDEALHTSILTGDPTALATTGQNCGQYGAAVLDFRARNPFAGGAPAEAPAAGANADPAKLGLAVATQFGCAACHSVDGKPGVGPTWKGIAGHEVELADGSKANGDDAYLKESILTPNAKVVKGFQPNVMPATFGTQLKPEQIDQVIAYIKSLK
ncbi:MAG: c-type cytochrome [Chloroflexota bacterium]